MYFAFCSGATGFRQGGLHELDTGIKTFFSELLSPLSTRSYPYPDTLLHTLLHNASSEWDSSKPGKETRAMKNESS
jgi:hypothetical protein